MKNKELQELSRSAKQVMSHTETEHPPTSIEYLSLLYEDANRTLLVLNSFRAKSDAFARSRAIEENNVR